MAHDVPVNRTTGEWFSLKPKPSVAAWLKSRSEAVQNSRRDWVDHVEVTARLDAAHGAGAAPYDEGQQTPFGLAFVPTDELGY
jgi:hypothetical protein